MSNELELITTEELIAELVRRSDHLVLAYRIDLSPDGNEDIRVVRQFEGDTHVCLGLCVDVQSRILEAAGDMEREED
jgi:hypothetical protein